MTKLEWNKKICSYTDYYRYSEFKCKCGKCSSPAFLNPELITYLDEMRSYFKKPVVITSGIRCKKYNDSLPGSRKNSQHLKGNAVDVYIKGVDPAAICNWWVSRTKGYCYCGTPNMGSCAHLEIV